ncbi:MAG: response regulator transcription factor [Candidatus Sedimenticola sp. 1PA]
MKTVLLVEDQKDTRVFFNEILVSAFDQPSVVEASTLAQAREKLNGLSFNLALLDISLPDGSGIDLIPEVLKHSPETYVVMATIYDDDRHLFSALRSGAHGYLLKEQRREELMAQLKGILSGQPPLSPSIARRILNSFHERKQSDKHGLTPREIDVLTLLAKGYTRNELADMLGISANTGGEYIKKIYRKFNINSRAEAVLEAARLGLVATDGQ